MPSHFSTSNRMYFLTLQDYGEDDLLIDAMSGHEAVSQLFEFKLRLLSEHEDIDPERIIGRTAILRIETDGRNEQGERHWNGYVSRFTSCGRAHSSADGQDDMFVYECDIVPWFWFMTQHEDCRIFQELTVPEIIETIFGEFNYSDFRIELKETHPKLEYCTQYNETTFDFISRLIEREGIHYYFRHHDDGGESRHLLVFTDHKDGNPKLDPHIIPFHEHGHAEEGDAITHLVRNEQMRTRQVTLSDWSYEKRNAVSENTPTMLRIGADWELERYRYPGDFTRQDGSSDPTLGKHRSQVLMEAEESSHLQCRGSGQARSLTPGHIFTLEDHHDDRFNIEYLVLAVWHHGRNNLGGEEGASDYRNDFLLQPHERVYRAPLTTPRGQVRGPQTAVVVGPQGEEIYTDSHGRIKVRFPWDRKVPRRTTNTQDDKASCWVRVAQMWAGNGYGTLFMPRIGMEVVVDFLEGDPDRPIVVGCVYNGINQPPLALPGEATRSTIKTLSSKGGGGYNELRFEDKKGHEEIYLHAQKNLQLRTGNCRTEAVGVHSDLTVGKNHTETIGEDRAATVGKNETIAVGQHRALTVGADDYRTVGANHHTDVRRNSAHTASLNLDLTAGANLALTSGANTDIKAGTNLVLEAGTIISLKAGSSSIVLSPAGVQITGTMVFINSGGSPMPANKAMKAEKADKPKEALEAINSKAGKVTNPTQQLQAKALRNAARAAQPFCAECEAARAALRAMGVGA
ncbi:MAG: type VI secretion system tip protein TssI/VgrG [Thermomonas sp.]|uniref:type VI secretion system Vgr family protein n=1 Tax=Thermomonas sp. TaxID=1971895 RepID=UPI0039E25D23